MSDSIVDISHQFFREIVLPILQEKFPRETRYMTFGLFGHGSEALGTDDNYSRDHHWGIRIDTLMPNDIFNNKREEIIHVVSQNMPHSFMGHDLQETTRAGAGLAPDSLEWFLLRTIGIDHPPNDYKEWLEIPEEDIVHVINGEVWHDPDGKFTAVRERLQGYYPEPVRLRRIAHWCRYYSGMGTYALKRAVLRGNQHYATIAFARAIRLGVQLAFLLDKEYYPYDKWTQTFFTQLPRMYGRMGHLVEEAVELSTGWERKMDLLDHISDVLDQTMVEDGIIDPHPRYVGSDTSGYRLMEVAYQQILKKLPDAARVVVPLWDQVHLERFVTDYVSGVSEEVWINSLNLKPADGY